VFLLFGMIALIGSDAWQGGDARKSGWVGLLRKAPDMESDAVWIPLLGAMIAIVLVDACLRVFLWLRLPRRPVKRGIVLSVAEYSLTWPVLLAFFLPFASLYVLISTLGGTGSDVVFLLALLSIPLFWLLAGIACYPAASFLFVCSGPGGPPVPRRRWRRRAFVWGMQTFVFVLLCVSVGTGGYLAARASDTGEQPETSGPLLEVTYLECLLGQANPHVNAALHNPTGDPIVVDPARDLHLQLQADGDADDPPPFAFGGDAQGLPLLVQPGATQLARIPLAGQPAQPLPDAARCELAGEPGGPGIKMATTSWLGHGGD